jgi:hypothetical protein
MRMKYHSNEEFRRASSRTTRGNFHRKYWTNLTFRESYRTEKRFEMRLKYMNKKFMNARNAKMRLKYVSQAVFRIHCINRMRSLFLCDPAARNRNLQTAVRRRAATSAVLSRSVGAAISAFSRKIEEGPVIACTSCHRHMYRQNVVSFCPIKYSRCSQRLLSDIISLFGAQMVCKLFICKTCHSHLLRGNLPAQAAVNDLQLHQVPTELQLSELESVLVAQRILFMKLFALPRGRQRAITGAVVNVPSNVKSVVSSLPLTPSHAGLIAIKLKRRLQYKGYVTQQFVRPEAVIRAVKWLTANNPLYHDISLNAEWFTSCTEEDSEVWNGLCGNEMGEKTCNDVESSSNSGSSINTELEDDNNNKMLQKVRGLKYNTCLQPTDPQYACNELSMAPAEGQTPLDFMMDTNSEVLAFPCKFPTGNGGLTDERVVKLTPGKYFIQRILNKDKRFASDPNYIFYAQFVTEQKQVRDNISVALRQTAGHLSAGHATDVAQLRQLVQRDSAFNFLQTVRGTPAYFQRAVRELIAMVAQLGCPHFFLTLSAADMSWPELFRIIHKQNTGWDLSDDDIANLTYEQKVSMIRNDPVVAARHFDHRLQAFFTYILGKAAALGTLKYHFYRIEFQMRGSPHCHAILWSADGPNMKSSSDNDIVQFFSDKITAELPTDDDALHDLVHHVQRHSHSVACKKKKTNSCRFHFPRPPSDRMILTTPIDDKEDKTAILEWQQNILSRVHLAIDELSSDSNRDITTTTLQDVLSQCKITNNDYHKALSITDSSSRTLILKRKISDININNYNRTILTTWKANMDVQPILDPYACIMYVVSYITKDERDMSELLKAAKKENSNNDIRTQLKKVGYVWLTHRELSAQESVYRLLGLSMLSCNVRRVFVPADLPENRVRILKSMAQLEKLDPDSHEVYMTGLIQRYAARPDSLSSMCLADFAVEYDVCYGGQQSSRDDVQPSNDTNEFDRVISLQKGMGKMRHRKVRAVMLTHKFSVEKEPEKFYHSQLMLFIPWRDEENDLLGGCHTYAEAHTAKESEIAAVKLKFEYCSSEITSAINSYINHGPPVSAWDALASQQQQDNESSTQEGAVAETFIDSTEDDFLRTGLPDENVSPSSVHAYLDKHRLIPDDDYYSLINSLNFGQQQIFQFVLNWCRMKRLDEATKPFYIFCSGGAGTGKSHVIHAIVQMANRELHRPGDNPDEIVVQLAAPTGTAAYNISGGTLHSLFLLNIRSRCRSSTLSADKLATLRNKFSSLKILIIDEVSMVGANLLVQVHERLAAIAGLPSSTAFAGVSILAVGDLQQLSPVREPAIYKPPTDDYYALARLWMSNFSLFELTETMRQKGDNQFANLLGRLRIGQHTADDISLLKTRQVAVDDPSNTSCSLRIFSLNADVDKYNDTQLDTLQTQAVVFKSIDRLPAEIDNKIITIDEHNSGLPSVLTLKIGARVMLIRNVNTELGLFNGALGTVSGFSPLHSTSPVHVLVSFDNKALQTMASRSYPLFNGSYPIERYEGKFPVHSRGNKYVEATRLQFPLKIAFAITIHKCQGQTLESVVVSLKGCFGPGQAYVAFSRCKSLSGLQITDFNDKCVKINRQGLAAVDLMRAENCFTTPHGLWLHSCSKTEIRLSILNTRSLYKHAESIKSSIYLSVSDVMVFTESRLHGPLPDVFSDYTALNVNAPTDRNNIGGVVILWKSSHLTVTNLENIELDKLQLLTVCIESSVRAPFIVVALYRSPAFPLTELKALLQAHVQSLRDNYQHPILLVGDFNADARKTTVLGIPQCVTKSTHIEGAIIDHVYWTGNNGNLLSDVVPCYWSDHNIVTVTLRTGQETSASNNDGLTIPNVSGVNYDLQHTLKKTPEATDSVDPSSGLAYLNDMPSTSAPPMSAGGHYQCSSFNVYTRNLSSTFQFLESAFDDNQLQIDVNIPVKDFLIQRGLKVRPAPANGHCLLHSWATATQSSVEDIKQIILNEFTTNAATYVNAGIDGDQLLQYLNKHNYQLDAVDAVIDILCNATHITAFVIGQKYDFTNPNRIRVVRNVTEIRRIAPLSSPSTCSVLLLKSREHYDAVV